ncbi:sensor domain-containing protein [Rhodococcus sp. IEGM 1381]|uniref:sensor histidine kinase n=1 Tax=Rhodococcus sp. IEGM 1381 TaxID=3047085 RepID=UPI0024B670BC|nr:sensor histidine kinase [Rhodococcus sp. IEGM 1381]MDI9894489.1 sensor domain-containing protein [Rhodococcus sp. IEGM 1381]
MSPRTAWQAISLNPLRFVATTWPFRGLAYLSSGVVFGAVAGTVLVALAVAGIVLTLVVVGVGLLVAAVLFSTVVARVERWRLRLIDLDPAPSSHVASVEPGFVNMVRLRLTEPVTWRELGYCLLSIFGLWWLDLVVLMFAIGAPIVCIRSAVNDPTVWPWGILGVALIPSAPFTITIWAAAHGSLARVILGPRGSELGNELTEVKQSRARLVAAFDDERTRIERDLHDGAQQRLASLRVTLGLIRLDAADGSIVHSRIGEAQDQLGAAMREIRDLVRGVRPQTLGDLGLAGAVVDLATHCAVPVDVDVSTPRLEEQVERPAYFVVAECLTNVTKHSGATRVDIHVRHRDDLLVMRIRDNGKGGARADSGGGLAGLADRLAVVDGRLRLSSPPGGPTLVYVDIPCRSI